MYIRCFSKALIIFSLFSKLFRKSSGIQRFKDSGVSNAAFRSVLTILSKVPYSQNDTDLYQKFLS